jgi:hypothetical protein
MLLMKMQKILPVVVLMIVGLGLGSAVFLVTWDIPAPITKVEKVISYDKFQH